MTILKIVFNWLLTLAFLAGCYYVTTHTIMHLASWEVILLGLSLAFIWVEVFKWGSIKPFSCVKCMTGWFCLILGVLSFGWHGLIYLPMGVFIGAMYEGIKLRWL